MPNSLENKQNKRALWIDVFKGIGIILVVIGHSTGKYNLYIYQFHMALFFFISGYCTNFSKRNVLQTIVHRFKTLLLPYLIIFAGLLLFIWFLVHIDVYKYLFADTMPYIGVKSSIQNLIFRGDNYTWWMGAGWFIIVLFQVQILHKIIDRLFPYTRLKILISVALFIFGYILIKSHRRWHISAFSIDLMCIGQFYFFLGQLLHKKNILEKISKKTRIVIVGFVVTSAICFFFSAILPTTVDYPSRRFGAFYTDALAAFNGILLVYVVSMSLAKKTGKYLPAIFAYLGKYSISILYFHFMFFNVAYFIMYRAGVVSIEYLQSFTPAPGEASNKYWLFIAAVAIVLSLLLWKLCLLVKKVCSICIVCIKPRVDEL